MKHDVSSLSLIRLGYAIGVAYFVWRATDSVNWAFAAYLAVLGLTYRPSDA